MTSKQTPVPSPALRFPWHGEYCAALWENDRKLLFKRVEIAEAAQLSRREALSCEYDGRAEEKEIAAALEKLAMLKKDVLKFSM